MSFFRVGGDNNNLDSCNKPQREGSPGALISYRLQKGGLCIKVRLSHLKQQYPILVTNVILILSSHPQSGHTHGRISVLAWGEERRRFSFHVLTVPSRASGVALFFRRIPQRASFHHQVSEVQCTE